MLAPDGSNYSNRDYNQFAAFVIIAAGLTFIISLVLLIALCADKLSPRNILEEIQILEDSLALQITEDQFYVFGGKNANK